MLKSTPGIHNIACIGWTAMALLCCAIVAIRLAHAILIWRSLAKSNIAFIPKGGGGIRSLPWLIPKHQEEAILLLQAKPDSYIIPVKIVPGHVDMVREVSPNTVDVDVIGSGSCTVIVGLKHEALKYVSTLRNIDSLESLATYISSSQSFESSGRLSFSVPPSGSSGDERHSLVVFLRTLSNVEISFVTQSQANLVFQFLIPFEDEVISIRSIYSQNVDECMVCYDAQSNVVILDCRHCCICTECMRRLRDSRCIVCRHRFNKYLYLPRQINV